jgi:hypothetical protein|tara:strand:+ start:529 stop:714 length:186 start_codon:yes stop_codon:yes gene_type:complete
MQFYRKTRKGFGGMLLTRLAKIFIYVIILMIIIFLIGNLDLPAPNKNIKQKIPDEKFKVIK